MNPSSSATDWFVLCSVHGTRNIFLNSNYFQMHLFYVSAELKMEIIRAREIRQTREKQLQNEQKNKGEEKEESK